MFVLLEERRTEASQIRDARWETVIGVVANWRALKRVGTRLWSSPRESVDRFALRTAPSGWGGAASARIGRVAGEAELVAVTETATARR